MSGPRHPHHCPHCLYLGQWGQYDLYYHRKGWAHAGCFSTFPLGGLCTVSARNVNNFPFRDYAFGNPENVEALRLAVRAGLIPKTAADLLTLSSLTPNGHKMEAALKEMKEDFA
jgi:hypothetical protein